MSLDFLLFSSFEQHAQLKLFAGLRSMPLLRFHFNIHFTIKSGEYVKDLMVLEAHWYLTFLTGYWLGSNSRSFAFLFH